MVHLYGEAHGVKEILDKELELWKGYYKAGYRHLFVEHSYFNAEFLNLWMKADDDTILLAVYDEWEQTLSHNPQTYEFYRAIKSACPETVFHGTDVGHQYSTTGQRYLDYLRETKAQSSEQWIKAQEAIQQGIQFYREENDVYRENTMVKNFIRELDVLGNEPVMGIYGAAHTGLHRMDITGQVPSMAQQLAQRYGSAIQSTDLSYLAKQAEPFRVDEIVLGARGYRGLYYGRKDMTGFKDIAYLDFWLLENAWEDFKGFACTGNVLPHNNYPMQVHLNQVYRISITKTDGSTTIEYYLSTGKISNGTKATQEVRIK